MLLRAAAKDHSIKYIVTQLSENALLYGPHHLTGHYYNTSKRHGVVPIEQSPL